MVCFVGEPLQFAVKRSVLIIFLRDEGKTLQEIADALGYKSVSSVHNLITKS